MATNPNHPSSSTASEAIEKKNDDKAIFGPGEIREKGTSDVWLSFFFFFSKSFGFY